MTSSSSNLQIYRVLVVGRDVSELSAGANLLTQAGYTTDLVVTLDQAVRRAIVGRYHLAVVSSTFTYDEQVVIRARLKQAKPSLPALLLGPEHAAPDALRAAVAHCLKKRPILEFNPGASELLRLGDDQ
jgi:DNA-binding NtrC family response regulator